MLYSVIWNKPLALKSPTWIIFKFWDDAYVITKKVADQLSQHPWLYPIYKQKYLPPLCCSGVSLPLRSLHSIWAVMYVQAALLPNAGPWQCIWEGTGRWADSSGPCHPRSFWLLTFTWASLLWYSHLGVKHTGNLSLSLICPFK